MTKCRPWHGDKLKVGNSTAPKFETVTDDDDDLRTFVLDIPVDTPKEISEQDVVDNNSKSIDGFDHIVDSYINMEVRLPEGEKELYGKVVGLCLDKDGRMIIGTPDSNPYMNTVLYEIKFDDGTSKAYGANVIAENIWRSVNNEGCQEDLLHSVIDIRFKTDVVKNAFMYNQNGKRILKKTTRGVDLLVALKSGQNPDGTDKASKSWIPLKEEADND